MDSVPSSLAFISIFLTSLGWLILFIGFLAYYAAFFLREGEEGRLQNRIEKLWVTIDDRSSVGRTSALFSNVAKIVTRGFNRLFGRRLISFQFIGVSTCCSFATLCLFVVLAVVLMKREFFGPLPPDLSKMLPFLEHTFLIVGVIFSLLAVLPSTLPSRWAIALSMIPAVFFGATFLYMTKAHLWTPKRWSVLGGLLLSLLSDILLLVLVRFTVRWVSAKTSVWRIAVTLLLQAGIIYFLVFVPFSIPQALPFEDFRQSTTLMTLSEMGGLNIFTGIASSVFLLTLIFVLLHRITWPILSRLFYPLARYEVVRNPKIMFRMGTACLLLALPLMHEGAVKSFVRWLAKEL